MLLHYPVDVEINPVDSAIHLFNNWDQVIYAASKRDCYNYHNMGCAIFAKEKTKWSPRRHVLDHSFI